MTPETPHSGEGLALDFVNTAPVIGGVRHDFLADARGLSAWLELAGIAEADAAFDADALSALHRLRTTASACLEAAMAGADMPDAALAEINAAAAAAPRRSEVVRGPARQLRKEIRRLGSPAEQVTSQIAEAVLDLLVDPALPRLKACAAPDCVVLFVPLSAKRVWCSPQRCGNRMRVSRYYHRHKAAE